jgi:urea transport system substrate-binding protein
MRTRRGVIFVVATALGLLIGGVGAAIYFLGARSGSPIRVGILHSLSGTMRFSESPVVDATRLAIEELNAAGGLLGRRIEPVVVDGQSEGVIFAREAERLITTEKVSVIFGCWTSASRKTVKPVIEAHDHLLFYPVQYEGLEESPNIVYTGAAPNQQIIPAVKWSFDNLGKRFFLVGSDYVFPRTANAIIRDLADALGAEVLGEEYVVLGRDDFRGVVADIARTRPDVIFSSIAGHGNVAFFRELRAAGITPADIPTMSFTETELQSLGVKPMVGDYASWNYFQTLDTPENREFVSRFRARYGPDRVTTDAMEAAYFGVHLWAQAVNDAGTDDVSRVREHVERQSLSAPSGIVYVDPQTLHTWKTVRIGRIRGDGQFDIVWSSDKPIRPEPFPILRSRTEWITFLHTLYVRWGGTWANPGTSAKGYEASP